MTSQWRLDWREMRPRPKPYGPSPHATGTEWHDTELAARVRERWLRAKGWEVYVYEVELMEDVA